MAEEKKAKVNVVVKLTTKLYFKNCTNTCSDAVITFNMSDVPVDAVDDQIEFAAADAIASDLKKGTGILKCMLDDDQSFIAIDAIACLKIKDFEINRGE